MGRAPFGHVDSFYCLALTDHGSTAKISIKANYGAVAREILISAFGNGKSESGPTTLLTRFAEELRRVGVGLTAGGGGLEWGDENGSRGE